MVSKTHSLRWLENLKQSQRLTAREERRKKKILEVFRELCDISARQPDPRLPALAPFVVTTIPADEPRSNPFG